MKKYIPHFLIFWAVNSFLLYFATMNFPWCFVLGNWRFSAVGATIASGAIWTTLVFFAEPALSLFKFKVKGIGQMLVFYFLANFVALWITARLAPYFGFGTTRFVWLAGLAVIADFVQFGIWKALKFKG